MSDIKVAAKALSNAAASGVPADPVSLLIGERDIAAAYAVQDLVAAARSTSGGRQTGWKIAFAGTASMAAFGISEPASGQLFEDMVIRSGTKVPKASTCQPRVEAEIAFVMGRDAPKGEIALSDLLDAVDHIRPAIEIVDTRISGKHAVTDAIADNASGSLYLPSAQRFDVQSFDLAELQIDLKINGAPVGTGIGRNVYGSPANALLWLARHLAERGLALKAGDIVMSGALIGPIPVSPGDRVEITAPQFDPLTVNFSGT